MRTPPLTVVGQPGGAGDFDLLAPGGVDITNDLNFYFDRVGRPRDLAGNLITSAAALSVSIDRRTIRITPETGLVSGN